MQKLYEMPPNATSIVECTGVLNEADAETVDGGLNKNVVELKHANDRKIQLVWRNIILFAYVHLAAVYGLYLMLASARIYTGIFGKNTAYLNVTHKYYLWFMDLVIYFGFSQQL